ncbi:MAG: FG-GAP repeat protein, partial [Nanoarchaeota archaeon]|nr:FG-GAP repeat protein [Nanoarchaeota archaeon]
MKIVNDSKSLKSKKGFIWMGIMIGLMMIFSTFVSAGISEIAKIQASDKQANDYFGCSASISSDGNTAIVGAYAEDTGGSEAGAAYIYRWNGAIWIQQAKIQATDKQATDYFGKFVSISYDGDTAIVGSYYEDTGGSAAGAAYIFTWTGATWTQQKIQADDIQGGDHFGESVSISSDGESIIVGAYAESTGGSQTGAAYIFEWTGTTWTQKAKIQASDQEASEYFGSAVSISSDGNDALVGAYLENTGGNIVGAAYIFEVVEIVPIYTKFQSYDSTTNFSEEAILTSVPNLTLAIDGKGKIKFPVTHSINSENEDYDTNIVIEDKVIFVNSSALDSTFNSSATLTFY